MKKCLALTILLGIVFIVSLMSFSCQNSKEIPDRKINLEKYATLAEEIKADIDHVQNVRLEKWLTIDRYSESWAEYVQNIRDLQEAIGDIKKKVEELEDSLLEDKKQYEDDEED